jgi:hypothetical protein
MQNNGLIGGNLIAAGTIDREDPAGLGTGAPARDAAEDPPQASASAAPIASR